MDNPQDRTTHEQLISPVRPPIPSDKLHKKTKKIVRTKKKRK
jgi:hypothetical protein